MARDTTLSAAATHRRRSADAGDPSPGGKVWAVRLPAHHGAVAECGVAGGEGSSAADLATRRAEGTTETKATRAVVARGWCVRLRPERANHVWSYDFVKAMTHDGRALRILVVIDEYARECLALRVARRLGKFAGDRNVGGCDVGARDTRAHSFRVMGRSSLPRSCGSGWERWARRRCTSRLGVRGRTGTARASMGNCATSS
jgi:transposase InsO family protein